MTGRSRSIIPLAAAGLTSVLFLSACQSGSGGYNGAGNAGAGNQAAPGAVAAPNQAPALNAVRAFDIGELVVDGNGMTVYRYDKDSTKPPRSTCEGACAVAWPPVLSSSDLKLTGIDQNLLGSVTRSDGSDQVTLGGWPLYRHGTDHMPGETGGMGKDGVWFPIAPDGKKVMPLANGEQPGVPGL